MVEESVCARWGSRMRHRVDSEGLQLPWRICVGEWTSKLGCGVSGVADGSSRMRHGVNGEGVQLP